jgi:tRNA 2-selenouridine synthase SelU
VADGSNATDTNDADLVYDHTRFRKYKAYRRFTDDYRGRLVAIERRLVMTDFDERAPRIRAALEAQGWAAMVEDHRPAIIELVREFYANLHRRAGDSFFT